MTNVPMTNVSTINVIVNSEYSKCPGNTEHGKKIIKCACSAYLKCGAKEIINSFIKNLYTSNIHVLFTENGMNTIRNIIFKTEESQATLVEFLTMFWMEISACGLATDTTLSSSIINFLGNGTQCMHQQLSEDLYSTNELIKGSANPFLLCILYLKFESCNLTCILNENKINGAGNE